MKAPDMQVMSGTIRITLREWRRPDISALTRYANNRKIWLNLRDRFPHPYTVSDAQAWIAACEAHRDPTMNFAIDISGEAIGGIGLKGNWNDTGPSVQLSQKVKGKYGAVLMKREGRDKELSIRK